MNYMGLVNLLNYFIAIAYFPSENKLQNVIKPNENH